MLIPPATTDSPVWAGNRSADLRYPSSFSGWTAVCVLFLLYVLSMIDRNLLTVLAVPVQKDLQLSEVQLSLLFGASFAITNALAGLPFGSVVDRSSRRTLIACGLTLWSLSTVVCGLSRTFASLFVGRMGAGAGEASLNPAAQSILADMFPPSRLALPTSIYTLGGKVGQGLSLVLAGFFASLIDPSSLLSIPYFGSVHGWQLIFLLVAMPGFVIGLSIYLVPEPPRTTSAGLRSAGYRDYLQYIRGNSRFVFGHHVALAAMGTITGGLLAWAPVFFVRVHGWTESQVGYGLGVVLLAGPIIGAPLHGALADWWCRRGRADAHLVYLLITMVIAYPLGVAAFLAPTPALTLVLFFGFLCVAAGYVSLPMTVLQIALKGHVRGKALAVLFIFTGAISLGGGPTLVALITEYGFGNPRLVGHSLAVWIALMMPISFLLYVWILKPYRRLSSAQTD